MASGRSLLHLPTGPTLSIVTPAHNEEHYLEDAVSTLTDGLRRRGHPFEVVICENGSTDATARIADGLARAVPEVRFLTLPTPDYGRALRAGFLAAHGDLVVSFDVDLVDLAFLDRALDLERSSGADIVIGTKRGPGADDHRALSRRVVTGVFSEILHVGFGLNATDTHGIKLLRRSATADLVVACRSGRDIFDTELVLRAERAGLRVAELPVRVVDQRPPRTTVASRIPRTLVGLGSLRMHLWLDARPPLDRQLTPGTGPLGADIHLLRRGMAPPPGSLEALSRPVELANPPLGAPTRSPPPSPSPGALLASGAMDEHASDGDDLEVRLHWPHEQSETGPVPDGPVPDAPVPEAPVPDARVSAVPDARPAPSGGLGRPSPSPSPVDTQVLSAVTTLALRVESLAGATTSFRTIVTDHLAEADDHTTRAIGETQRHLEEYRRSLERLVERLDSSLQDTEAALGRLGRSGAALVTAQEALAAQLGQRLEEAVDAGRHRGDDLVRRIDESSARADTAILAALEEVGQRVDRLATAQAAHTRQLERLTTSAGEATDRLEERLGEQVTRLVNDQTKQVNRLTASHSAEMERLAERVEELAGAPGGAQITPDQLEELNRGIDLLTDPANLGSQEQILDALGALAAELTSLRRRIPVRARPEPGLDAASVAALADAVATRLRKTDSRAPGLDEADPIPRPRGRRA